MNKKELLAQNRMLLEALVRVRNRVSNAPRYYSVVTDVKAICRDVLKKVNEGTT